MNLTQRIDAFIELGKFLRKFPGQNKFSNVLEEIVESNHIYNPWFTKNNILQSIYAIGESLQKEKIQFWINTYPNLDKAEKKRKIGVITAGNIPLVGFHDFMCVIISGNIFKGKLSTKDNRLLKFISDFLIEINNDFKDQIFFLQDKLDDFDAVIATGSNNTARYFDYYFGKYPNIIRKNRSSVAVLDGTEKNDDIKNLGIDIFSYFGLGCRNVSKLYLPEDFNLDMFFDNIQYFQEIYNHNKYANNYDYNKSVYLMNQIQHFDNGFVIVKEDTGFASPIGVVFFEYYNEINHVKNILKVNDDQIQCVVSKPGLISNSVDFGKAQSPELWDYADNVDTMKFLLELK